MQTSSMSDFQRLLTAIKGDYPNITFAEAENFRWSDENRTIYYDKSSEYAAWSLLHELGHMVGEHVNYTTDAMLVRMEVGAWETALSLAGNYGCDIDEDYVQDCIDSYRNWQYKRSMCPRCHQTGLETNNGEYRCINCRNLWQVSKNRFCRVYRRKTLQTQ